MRKRPVMAALVVCAAALFQPLAQAAPAKILAIGDSITRGVGGQCSFRRDLSQDLAARAGCDVSFVGPRAEADGNPQRCQATNTRHASFPGWKADRFINDGLIPGYMSEYSPDYVLIHLGSNDINQGESVSSTVDDINDIIDQTLAGRPSARVLLANVIPWDPRGPGNQLALTAQLTAALNEVASERSGRGEAVSLVDVANGFNPGTMSADGIHPNDTGERFMASRFLSSLEAAGACGVPAPELPVLALKNNTWAQISLPADPGTQSTVADIFNELPISEFDDTWAVYGTDVNRTDIFAYDRLTLSSRMQPGQGYWVIQKTGAASVNISLPAGSLPVQTAAGAGCAPGKACYAVDLRTRSNGVMWNFIGYPFPASASVANTRIRTAAGGCTDGCTLNQARDNDTTGRQLFHYDPDDNPDSDYRRIDEADTVKAWEGVWLPALRDAAGQSPSVLFAP